MSGLAIPHSRYVAVFGWFADAWKFAAEQYGKWQVYRVTLQELDALNDRELSDVGISRFQIKEVAYEHAYK